MKTDFVKSFAEGIFETIGKEISKVTSKMNSEFEVRCLQHYLSGKGEDIILSEDEFARISAIAKEQALENGKLTDATAIEVNGKKYFRKIVSFYNCTEFDYALGNAHVFFDENNNVVGFKDRYDFNPATHRGEQEEALSRLMKKIEIFLDAKEYDILYGIYK